MCCVPQNGNRSPLRRHAAPSPATPCVFRGRGNTYSSCVGGNAFSPSSAARHEPPVVTIDCPELPTAFSSICNQKGRRRSEEDGDIHHCCASAEEPLSSQQMCGMPASGPPRHAAPRSADCFPNRKGAKRVALGVRPGKTENGCQETVSYTFVAARRAG
jgi:hypothetical protein